MPFSHRWSYSTKCGLTAQRSYSVSGLTAQRSYSVSGLTAQRSYSVSGLTALAVLLLLLCSCNHKDVKLRTDAISNRAAIPALNTDSVTTLISDSGITRYRITATKWLVFDKAEPPYWEFPEGIYLERFDEQLVVNSQLEADYAHYNQESHEWHLKGNVHSVNENGEIFDTPELYWNQDKEQIFSDSSIVITRERTIIRGVGFRSNQSMTLYTITNPTGIIPIEENDSTKHD